MNKTKSSFKDSNRATYFLIGLIISLSLSWYAFEHKSYNKPKEVFLEKGELEIDQTYIVNTAPEKKKKPEPKLDNKKLNLVDDDKKTKFDLKINNIETTPDEVIDEVEPDAYDKDEKFDIEKPFFVVVEEMPKFKGGTVKLYEYIYGNIEYPELANQVGAEGIVYVRFIVKKDGSVKDVKIHRGIGYGIDKEVLEMMKDMPDWIPGKQRGEKVNVEFILPIEFKLK